MVQRVLNPNVPHRAAVRGWPDVFEAFHVHESIRRVLPKRSVALAKF